MARYDLETVSVYQDLEYQPPWPALMQLAERTRVPLVGPAVVNPYLTHPILIAGHVATIDELSGGRAYLGIGRGAFLEAIGVEQPRPVASVRECAELVQHLLAGNSAAYDGEVFLAAAGTRLRFSLPSSRVPLLIGGWGRSMLGLAGEIADIAKIGGSANPASVASFRARVDAGARRAGRDPREVRLMLGAVTVVDRDAARARAHAQEQVAMYLGVVARLDPTFELDPDELERFESALRQGDRRAAGAALAEDTLRRFCTFGTPAQIVRQLEELAGAGVELFELGTPHGVDEALALRLLGEEVVPGFHR